MLKRCAAVMLMGLSGLTIACSNSDPGATQDMMQKSVCSYVPPPVPNTASQLMDLKCTACLSSPGCESDQMVNIAICEKGTQETVYRVTAQDKTGHSLNPLYYISVGGQWLSAADLAARVMAAKMQYDLLSAKGNILADATADPSNKCEH